MWFRAASNAAIVAILAVLLSNCGGGGSAVSTGGGGGGEGGGGGGGGGGTANGVSITQLVPSQSMVGVPVGIVEVIGQGFNSESQVLVNGQPVITLFDGVLQAEIAPSLNITPGIYQFSVQTGGQVSNSLPYTVYAPQQGPSVMQAFPGFLVSENDSNPPFIVAADVNGDGLSDVILPSPAPSGSNGIAILFGQPAGTLSSPQYISVPNAPYAMAVGDIDGNGTADLVSISFTSGTSETTVATLSGDGHGNFQAPVTQQTLAGLYPGPAYLADLDGDGKPDLVLSIGSREKLFWLKNTGGGFAAPVALAQEAVNSGGFAIADFNQDGKPDILYEATDSSFHILLNQGNGQFKDQVATGLTTLGVPNVLDFNLDGIPDVVVEVQGDGGQLVSFAGKGDGTFTQIASINTPSMGQLVSGDFDQDGFPDLAGPTGLEPSEIVYFFGDGHGNFVPQEVVGPEGNYAAGGDFNGDGIPDLVVADQFNFVSLALGQKGRNFPSPVSLTPTIEAGVSAGDINGDGLPDIFVGGDREDGIPGTVFLNSGNNSFQFGANTDPGSEIVADLTGKGVVDLLGTDDTNGNYLEIWPNNGTVNFSSSPIIPPEPMANVTVADMDGDGIPDIVSEGEVFYGKGSYQYTGVPIPNFTGPYVIGDFNGDGKPDIATASSTFLNMGGRAFQQVQGSGLGLDNGAVSAVGDFNGDGKDDVAVSIPGENLVVIFYSNGDGTFSAGPELDTGQEPGAIVAGDFNGDGLTDLVVGLQMSHQVCILFNSRNGQFSRSFFASGAYTVAMVSSDLNRDDKPDLVIGNFGFDFAPANVDVVFHQ
jgi:hypothetical protein